MGNTKFKLSDMIPNAWFYKLRDMGISDRYRKNKHPSTSSSSSSLSNSSSLFSSSISTSNSNTNSFPPRTKQPQLIQHRKSYYFTRDFSPQSQSPFLETKLLNSPVKSPMKVIRNRGNRTVCKNKPNSNIFMSSDLISETELLSSQSPILETNLPNSPFQSPKQRLGEKGNKGDYNNYSISPLTISSESGNSSINMNFKPIYDNFDGFDPVPGIKFSYSRSVILKAKLLNSPEQRIKSIGNRVPCVRSNFAIPISSDSDKSTYLMDLKLISENKPPHGQPPSFETKISNSLKSLKQRNNNRENRTTYWKKNPAVPISSETEKNGSNTSLKHTCSVFGSLSKTELPQIMTNKNTPVKHGKGRGPYKQRSFVNSTGVRLRSNSPRIRKINELGRKSISRRGVTESFTVVKTSSDPLKDFRESMVEMIQQNDIKGSKELEDLLACYLQLNCDEYHEMIIKVFKQIWFDVVSVGDK